MTRNKASEIKRLISMLKSCFAYGDSRSSYENSRFFNSYAKSYIENLGEKLVKKVYKDYQTFFNENITTKYLGNGYVSLTNKREELSK